MLTAKDYIDSNNSLIVKYQSKIHDINSRKYPYDGTMPMVCVKPMYESKIARLREANEYLKGFDSEHILTDDEQYKYRAIINGTSNV